MANLLMVIAGILCRVLALRVKKKVQIVQSPKFSFVFTKAGLETHYVRYV
jgi:ribosome biogenesis protein Nip4